MIETYDELITALNNFARNNPEFPIDFIRLGYDGSLSYCTKSRDRLNYLEKLTAPISQERFDNLVTAFWDNINWYLED